ncbi:unnamed protein product [Orchesella dallaii]|uniref:RRM domain-containing protein n=1 Tax=Orchesella dallaii TaxID=48710 RepID=A0ABP1QQD7_9HEXA
MTPTAEIKVETKMEVDASPGGGGGGSSSNHGNNSNNSNRGPKRKRGGIAGPGRNSFVGGRGSHHGSHERVDRRFGHDGMDGPSNKKLKVLNPEHRIMEKIRSLHGQTCDLPPKKHEFKKFLANTRLYIGNIAAEATESEVKELFTPFGEIDELFLNREKNFAFLKMDFRTNAERARAELDQHQLKGRPIKVRFAPASVRVRVKNLGPMVSNELLELAFGVFGEIERAIVLVDEKGKSTGEGIVDYTRKNYAIAAHNFCSSKCYFITSDLRPIITELGDMSEMDEGLLEINLPKREYNKERELVYYKAREVGPRVADDGTFEHEYGTKWKNLVKEFKEKEEALKEEMAKDLEKLQAQMEIARYDYETEMLREQLRRREIDHENRMQRGNMQFGGGYSRGGGDAPMIPREPMGQDGLNDPDSPNAGGALGFNLDFDRSSAAGAMPLAPPPLPPQGLMAHLQGGNGNSGNNPSGPTWMVAAFANIRIVDVAALENFRQI